MKRRLWRAVLLAASAAVVLAGPWGCGGGGGSTTPRSVVAYVRDEHGSLRSPEWAAFQNGRNGPWARVQPSAAGTFEFTVTSSDGAYGFAFLPVSSLASFFVVQATADEVSELHCPGWFGAASSTYTVSGSLNGLGAGQDTSVQVAETADTANSATAYSVTGVTPGSYDVLALCGPGGGAYDKGMIVRGLSVSGDTTCDVDFSLADTWQPGHTVTALGYESVANTRVAGMFGTANHLRRLQEQSGATSATFGVLAPALRAPGDLYASMTEEAKWITCGVCYQARRREEWAGSPGTHELSLPGWVSANAPTVADATHYARLRFSWGSCPGARLVNVEGGAGVYWGVTLTAGWLAGRREYTLPDLHGVSGFCDCWGPTDVGDGWQYLLVTSSAPASVLQDRFGYGNQPVLPAGTAANLDWVVQPGSRARNRAASPRSGALRLAPPRPPAL